MSLHLIICVILFQIKLNLLVILYQCLGSIKVVGVNLIGNEVCLRALRDDDLHRRIVWMNDCETSMLFTGTTPFMEYNIDNAINWRNNAESDPNVIIWAIDTILGTHIGDISLHSIDTHTNTAKLAVLIGDKNYWNKGYGTDAIKLVLSYSFDILKLHSIKLKVFEYNARAIRCYEKCGFKAADTLSYNTFASNRPNEIIMTITKNDYLLVKHNADFIYNRTP